MIIVDAMKRAIAGQKIKRKLRDEWILSTSKGTELRYASNRQKVILTVSDVLADDWICEEDVVIISRCQVEEAFKLWEADPVNGKNRFLRHLGFKWDLD